jgi:soluble lytic murein transglycosylase-like protein
MTLMRLLPILSVASLLAATSFCSLDARADIYSFKDERGVVHFTNIRGLDPRYKLIRREGGTAAMPRSTRAYMPTEADIRRYQGIVEAAAKNHGVDTALVHAVITAESGYNPRALSPKGASGLMQLMPDTARRYGVQNIFDPTENVHGGVRYLKDLLAMFNGNMELAVAGYNAGENAVIRAGHKVPPYAETIDYVPKVIDYYRKFRARQG